MQILFDTVGADNLLLPLGLHAQNPAEGDLRRPHAILLLQHGPRDVLHGLLILLDLVVALVQGLL